LYLRALRAIPADAYNRRSPVRQGSFAVGHGRRGDPGGSAGFSAASGENVVT